MEAQTLILVQTNRGFNHADSSNPLKISKAQTFKRCYKVSAKKVTISRTGSKITLYREDKSSPMGIKLMEVLEINNFTHERRLR